MNGRNINMTEGPLLGPILKFAFPLVITSMLQLMFNAVDIIVVGNYSGHEALAAVGSTGAIINLMVNIFVGLSIGASVCMGHFVGAKDYINAKETLHTAVALSAIGGITILVTGVLCAKPMLVLMKTPDEVLDLAALYLRIYFLGMPGAMIYNFGAALLRAVGDTKRPMYFLTIAGVVNVIFNLLFVIVFDMGVAGVAIATVISQYLSVVLIILSLLKEEGYMRLNISALKIHKDKVLEMIKIGLPAGFQGALFSISNILIQSGINSFGAKVMAGNTAAGNIEGFVYMGMNAVYQTSLSFTSQNIGARNLERVKKIFWTCLLVVTVTGLVLGQGSYLFGKQLLSLYTDEAEVIQYGMNRMAVICFWYFLCGIMDTMVGSLRGMGYSITPMIVSLTAVCLFRIIWIESVFSIHHDTHILYLSYPIAWVLASIGHFITFKIGFKKVEKRLANN